MINLEGKVAVVTGASRGIGAAVARPHHRGGGIAVLLGVPGGLGCGERFLCLEGLLRHGLADGLEPASRTCLLLVKAP